MGAPARGPLGAPASNAAALLLGQRLHEMHDVITALREAELNAVAKRHTADLEETKAFLAAQGSVEQRKQEAREATAELDFDAKVAEAEVRHLVRLLRETDKRVDVGRTYSADLRAELKTLGMEDGP